MDKGTFHKNLFEPGNIGKLKIKNRIIMAPVDQFAGPYGEVTRDTIASYTQIAKGGTGLIIVGGTHVMEKPERYTWPLLSLAEHRLLRDHYLLTESVHEAGGKICIQLFHVGSQMPLSMSGGIQTISPSGVPQFGLGEVMYETPRTATRAEIWHIIERFAQGAAWAKEAGYDMVEIHGAHGYLVNCFLSPFFNKRTDEFGGSLENRARIAIEILKSVRAATGTDFPVAIRINATDFLDGGITPDEAARLAQHFEANGIDAIDIGAGMHRSLHKCVDIMRYEEAWKRSMWEVVTRAVQVPTIVAGNIRSPSVAEKLLRDGVASFIALGRALWADPYWTQKAKQGLDEDINKCTSCLQCLVNMPGGTRRLIPRCTVNPTFGREADFPLIRPTQKKKKIIVVGGGPSGMEAALVASLRGHDVCLYEASKRLGGQLNIAKLAPGKAKWAWPVEYLETQLKKQRVSVETGVKVTSDLVRLKKPDVVIIATGATEAIPEIPGIDGSNVVMAWDVLQEKAKVRGIIAIAGGGLVGAETADFLAEGGHLDITIVEMLSDIALDSDPRNRTGLLESLNRRKVRWLVSHKVIEIDSLGLQAINLKTGRKKAVKADTVIVAMGSKSTNALAEQLEDDFEVHLIGDAKSPRRCFEAIHEGFAVARLV